MQVTNVIKNFLIATYDSKKKKKKAADINFNNIFHLNQYIQKYYHFNV